MSEGNNHSNNTSSQLMLAGDAAAISHLTQAIANGEHWYIALLQAINLWESEEEILDDRPFCYLVSGEALDWLLLAERLCQVVDHSLPENERDWLLFYGKPPINITVDEFREAVGPNRYRQYLNFFYGVIVEEALIMAVQDEVRKETWISGYWKEGDTTSEVYRRIYGASQALLLKRFRKEKGYPQLKSISLRQFKELIYWLFKYRFQNCEPVKVASDTKKALDWLSKRQFPRHLDNDNKELDIIDALTDTIDPNNCQ